MRNCVRVGQIFCLETNIHVVESKEKNVARFHFLMVFRKYNLESSKLMKNGQLGNQYVAPRLIFYRFQWRQPKESSGPFFVG